MLKPDAEAVTITSSVPVNTVLSGFLATPGSGTASTTARASRRATATPASTPSPAPRAAAEPDLQPLVGRQRRHVQLAGVDRAAADSAVKLPSRSTRPAGVHSAVLNLDDPKTAGVEYQTMNTVVAAEEFLPPTTTP